MAAGRVEQLMQHNAVRKHSSHVSISVAPRFVWFPKFGGYHYEVVMAGVIIASVVSAVTPYIVKAAQNYSIKYGPTATRKGTENADRYAKDAYHARDFVRRTADDNYQYITETELQDIINSDDRLLELKDNLMEFSDDESEDLICLTGNYPGLSTITEPRTIRLCYSTIRRSRDLLGTQAFGAIPLSFFSHWYVEIGGVSYELRDPRNRPLGNRTQDGRRILHEELGLVDKNIKLEVTANRKHYDTTGSFEVGTTNLTTEQIIRIASVIFRRFGQGYNLMVENCQLFCGLLAETIAGEENGEKIRDTIEGKSMLKLSVAASWVATPAYHLMATLHHAVPRSSSLLARSKFCRRADCILEAFEKLQYHPRVYAARKGGKPLTLE